MNNEQQCREAQVVERNGRVQDRYDELMREGKHGHYETLFRVVYEEVERAQAAWSAAQAAQPVDGKYSDIVSDGGLDPRNKIDAQPAQQHDPSVYVAPPMKTTCCGYEVKDGEIGPVHANPGNGVVQCHSCGKVYVDAQQERDAARYRFASRECLDLGSYTDEQVDAAMRAQEQS